MASYKRCIMILADGSRPDVFANLAEQGKLPNIKEHLIDQGSLKHAVTVFPSTTGPAYLPYLTGCYPGTCNVPGIRWFDREKYATAFWSRSKHRSYVGLDTLKMSHDVLPSIQTIFEIVPHSVNIFNGISKGISRGGNKTSFMRLWNWYYAHLTDRWSLVDENATRLVLKHLDSDPTFTFVVYPGIDEYSHMGDPFHSEALVSYERVDDAVGQMVDKLKSKGWWEESIILIVSDHGLSGTDEHLGVNQLLESNGVKTFFYPVVFKKGFAAAHMVSGNGMSHLYLAKGANGGPVPKQAWREACHEEDMTPLQQQALDLLDQQPAVDFMAIRAREGGAWVRRGQERARVYESAGLYCYEPVSGDPLRYGGTTLKLNAEDWLLKTYQSDYPDAVIQILQLIRSPRSGDVMLSAAPGYDLRLRYEVPEHHGSHGGLHRDHMMIPIISNVPFSGETCRSVDVFPTLLEWMGYDIPENIDGISRARLR